MKWKNHKDLSKSLLLLKGFTLLELLVTIAIAAVIMGIAVPGFMTAIKNNRLTATVNDFVAALNIARSEAVKRGYRVSVCVSSDGATCAAAGVSWDQGWLVFADANNNNTFDAAEAPPLKVFAGVSGRQITIVGSTVVQSRVTYSQTGQGVIPVGAKVIKFCDDRMGNFGKTITFNTLGRGVIAANAIC